MNLGGSFFSLSIISSILLAVAFPGATLFLYHPSFYTPILHFGVPIDLIRLTELTPENVNCLIQLAGQKVRYWDRMLQDSDEAPSELGWLIRELAEAISSIFLYT
jgi:hypothetical protein